MQNIDDLEWVSHWKKKHCDRSHEDSFKIYSVSNPGWGMAVNLLNTKAETASYDSGSVENSNDDWYLIQIKNGKFKAHGDLTKLSFMIQTFRRLMEECGETI